MTEFFTQENGLTRRGFLTAAAAASAAAMVLSTGCSPENSLTEDDNIRQNYLSKAANELAQGEAAGTWVPVACWHNCGGRCLNKALVKDGIVVRQKTDDVYQDEEQGHFQN